MSCKRNAGCLIHHTWKEKEEKGGKRRTLSLTVKASRETHPLSLSGTAILASKPLPTAGRNYPTGAASCPHPKPPELEGLQFPL